MDSQTTVISGSDQLEKSLLKRFDEFSQTFMAKIAGLERKIDDRDAIIKELLESGTVQDFYSPNDFAKKVNRTPDYVRELCRKGEIVSEKRRKGRGGKDEIRIPHAELVKWRNERS